MSPDEAMGMVADRLVGGMMFHSDHADLMSMLGIGWMRKLHERGFRDDSKSFRKVRSSCVRHLCTMAPRGGQVVGTSLDGLVGKTRSDIGVLDYPRLVKASMADWVEWEAGTAGVFHEASESLGGALWDVVHGLESDVEDELSLARDIERRMFACNYDMAQIYDGGAQWQSTGS